MTCANQLPTFIGFTADVYIMSLTTLLLQV